MINKEELKRMFAAGEIELEDYSKELESLNEDDEEIETPDAVAEHLKDISTIINKATNIQSSLNRETNIILNNLVSILGAKENEKEIIINIPKPIETKRKFTFKINRNNNGLIDTIDVVEK